MRKSIYTLFLSLLICFTVSAQAQKVTLTQTWESDTSLRTPESVLLEPKENVLYVSCINGSPNLENKGSFIAKVGLDGNVLNLKFTEGLNSPKGMGILSGKLYVTEMTAVAEIDLASGKILNRYSVDGAQFLNDITIDEKGAIVFISDSGTSKIWALKNGKLSVVTEGGPLKGVNGLLYEHKQLLIGNGDGSLLSFDPTTKKITTVAKGMEGLDGIVALGNKKYIVSTWAGKVWAVGADGNSELLIDSTNDKINTADLGYNPITKVLYVPTFFHNTVAAYSVK